MACDQMDCALPRCAVSAKGNLEMRKLSVCAFCGEHDPDLDQTHENHVKVQKKVASSQHPVGLV